MYTHLIIAIFLKALEDVKYICMQAHACTTTWSIHKLISVACWMLTILIYSHLSIGVFQRRLLLPPPENEIWPLLQHASCKLLLMHACKFVCAAAKLKYFTCVFADCSVSYFQCCFVSSFICLYLTFCDGFVWSFIGISSLHAHWYPV